MWPYVFTFGVSCLSATLADRFLKVRQKKSFLLFSAIAILLGSVLAGIRANSVGTDVMVYGNNIFRLACLTNQPLHYITRYQTTADIEPLYLLLNFVVSRFTHNVHWFYFILQLLTITLAYSAIVDLKKMLHIGLGFGLFVYYTQFYAFSLNGMRQALAMSIVFWAMRFIYRKNFLRYALCILVASGFHYSALICLFFPLISYVIQISRRKELTVIAFVSLFCVIALFTQPIIKVFASIFPKYSRYLVSSSSGLSINPFIIRAPFLLLYVLLYYVYKSRNIHTGFWVTMLCADAIFSMLRGMMPAMYRISLYFGMVKIYAYPYLTAGFKPNARPIVKGVLIAALFLLWYYQVALQGNEGVFPYVSDVLTWLS